MYTCNICHSNDTVKFLTRTKVPVLQNIILNSEEEATSIDRGDLNMVVCKNCGFIFNETFEPVKVSYNQNYENTQNYSECFRDYISDLIDYLINKKKLVNSKIVEIGCGKGHFLRELIENSSNRGFGFDPSYIGPETVFDGRIKFEKRIYDENCNKLQADVIISRHVIEHLHNPTQMLATIKNTNLNKTKIFFETPNIEWILKNNIFWDFFYEHCSYFSTNSIKSAFQLSGFHVDTISTIFNGQYLFLEGISSNNKQSIDFNPGFISDMASQFSINEKIKIKNWKDRILHISKKGKIALWGAGAKGVTFTNIIDPNQKLIDCIIDINPRLQGKFIPGSGHPIVSLVDASTKRNVKVAIIMNPNYYQEDSKLIHDSNLDLELVLCN